MACAGAGLLMRLQLVVMLWLARLVLLVVLVEMLVPTLGVGGLAPAPRVSLLWSEARCVGLFL